MSAHTIPIDVPNLTRDQARQVQQFASRKEAATAAEDIGWKRKDATPVVVMGFHMFVISDDHHNAVTRDGYRSLLDARRTLARARKP